VKITANAMPIKSLRMATVRDIIENPSVVEAGSAKKSARVLQPPNAIWLSTRRAKRLPRDG
jgi:hypothetical protein